jgi:hypothetical protein
MKIRTAHRKRVRHHYEPGTEESGEGTHRMALVELPVLRRRGSF